MVRTRSVIVVGSTVDGRTCRLISSADFHVIVNLQRLYISVVRNVSEVCVTTCGH